MPKARSSGNLAAAQNSGADQRDLNEMGQRAQDRITSSGSIGGSFSALNNLISRRRPSSGRTNSELGVNEAEEVLDQLDLHMEEERRNLIHEEDDEFFYTEQPDEEFNRVLEEVRNRELPYEYENVLNGSQVTFGVELEFVGGNADAIARDLYNLGICAYDRRVGYHSRSVPGKWKLERDGSVSSGSQGGELVSPVLTDTPETWSTLEKICEVAKRHGATIDQRCGGHVHIGIEPLNTARQRWKRFFKATGSFEDIMYRLAGGSLGHVRSNHTHYATRFSERARSVFESRIRLNDRNDIDNLTRRASGQDRYYGINLTNIYQDNKPNTAEFRYFNGSLDPAVIQANVKVANGVIMAAQKARTRNTSEEQTTAAFKKRGNLLREQPFNNSRNDTSIKRFVDVLFSRKKDKDAILGLYVRNSWV